MYCNRLMIQFTAQKDGGLLLETMFASAKNLLLKFHIKQVSYESSITQRKTGSKYQTSSKQTRTCSNRLVSRWKLHTLSKSSVIVLFGAHAAFPRFFPAICGKNHVFCKLWQSDWSIALLAAVPFAETKCKTLPLRHWECGRSSYFVFVTERRQTKHAAHRLPGRKGCVSTDHNWNIFLWSTHYIIFVKGNISSPWKHLSLQVE